jgi:hypothetical protein
MSLKKIKIHHYTSLVSSTDCCILRWENRAGVRPGVRVPGLEMTWNLDTNLEPDPNDSNSF